jgi:hypothetical protein
MSEKPQNIKEKTQTKSVYFSNIPRRKIYEEMLDFEDGLMEVDILQYNQENFDKYKEEYNKDSIEKMRVSFTNIKALLIMFLENRKYQTEVEYLADLKELIDNTSNTNKHLRKNKNFTIKQKYLLAKLDYIYNKHQVLKDLKHAKSAYKSFVKFNDEIPKILEIRRDNLK